MILIEKKGIVVLCSSGIDVNDEEDENGGLVNNRRTTFSTQQPFQEYIHMYT